MSFECGVFGYVFVSQFCLNRISHFAKSVTKVLPIQCSFVVTFFLQSRTKMAKKRDQHLNKSGSSFGNVFSPFLLHFVKKNVTKSRCGAFEIR